LQLQAAAKNITVENSVSSRIYIQADKDMINLVIRNLLSNAIKFTPEGGRIDITAQQTSKSVEIFVKDTGVGIEPHIVNQLFENSYYSTSGTAQETGTGLGLMLCKDFLMKNGGSIHVQSEKGKGSTFSFRLPKN
jgi:signal transduction histidine kinase